MEVPEGRGPGRRAAVFYNPAMRRDRDIAVAFFRAYSLRVGPVGRAWEMHAATGVRGLRVLNETSALSELTLTDTQPQALAVARANADRFAARGVRALAHDATRALAGERFDLVDIDPYGSPIPFVDAALGSLRAGGLLAVTATDLLVLAGVQSSACERRYGARPIRGRLGPEAGLRILLGYLNRRAEEGRQRIVPLLSYVGSHHLRAYLRLDPVDARGSTPASVGFLDPATFDGPRLPPGGPYGPLWTGPLFDPGLVGALEVPGTASEPAELARFLDGLRSELAADVPLYYEANELARYLGLTSPPAVEPLLEGLREAGWASGRGHEREGAFKTRAPRAEVERRAREHSGKPHHSQKARVRA
ncbi:MAG: hypothetical protein L3K09_03100 [Thermoplasmata archaeon]|nr:hypothetical protein [Thermoplasmata archaeon]